MSQNLTPATRRDRTRRLVMDAMLAAIILVLQLTPLGYIPIPGFNPTTMHIPVIVGAILLGPADGAFLGLVFGITSIIQATIQLPLTAFLFSPFVPFGSWRSAVIAIVPRVLIGVVAAYVFRAVSRIDKSKVIASALAAAAGSLTNTILVLGGILVLMRGAYEQQFKVSLSAILKAFSVVVGTSGVGEAVVAAVVAAGVCKALFAVMKRSRR